MILRLLKVRGMVSGLYEKKRDAIPPHPAPPQALHTRLHCVTTKKTTIDIFTVERIDISFACYRFVTATDYVWESYVYEVTFWVQYYGIILHSKMLGNILMII
jgi:hypothetical protein